MPGQCLRRPSSSLAKRPGSEVGPPSSLRTWAWTIVAPASKASCADSICSAMVIGTAGLSDFFGSEPVIATQMMQGFSVMSGCAFFDVAAEMPALTAYRAEAHWSCAALSI